MNLAFFKKLRPKFVIVIRSTKKRGYRNIHVRHIGVQERPKVGNGRETL